jgi:hypothetical protein
MCVHLHTHICSCTHNVHAYTCMHACMYTHTHTCKHLASAAMLLGACDTGDVSSDPLSPPSLSPSDEHCCCCCTPLPPPVLVCVSVCLLVCLLVCLIVCVSVCVCVCVPRVFSEHNRMNADTPAASVPCSPAVPPHPPIRQSKRRQFVMGTTSIDIC